MPHIINTPWSDIIKVALRSIAASFPGWASAGQAWNEFETNRTVGRIQELMGNLEIELLRVRERLSAQEQCAADFHDFAELLELTVEKVRREFREANRRRYACLLAKITVQGRHHSYEDKVSLLESLDTLSELDIQILRLAPGKTAFPLESLLIPETGLSQDSRGVWQLATSLARLEGKGLVLTISTHTGVIHLRDGFDDTTGRMLEKRYRVLPLGHALIAALE